MTAVNKQTSTDPFQLSRFVEAQDGLFEKTRNTIYEKALSELWAGDKTTHWMWFVFPQIAGLGTSKKARDYAIKGLDEAKAYLAHPLLGPRLRECCAAILAVEEKTARDIMNSPDDLKLKSSMTLFAQFSGPRSEFSRVLDKYYAGQRDQRTLDLLS